MSKNLKSDVDFALEIPEPNEIKGGTLNTNQLTYAKLASSAYEKSNSPDDIDGYICDRSYGQANSSVYYNQDLKEVVLARGLINIFLFLPWFLPNDPIQIG